MMNPIKNSVKLMEELMKPELKRWDVWYVDFPFEEDDGRSKDRPVIILDTKEVLVLTVKVTSHECRECDAYDVDIKHWEQAGLDKPSVARVSKLDRIAHTRFRRKIGTLNPQDAMLIFNTYKAYLSMLLNINKTIHNEYEEPDTPDKDESCKQTSYFGGDKTETKTTT